MTAAHAKNLKPKAPQGASHASQNSGLGLDAIGDLSSLLHPAPAVGNPKPILLDMALIEEDPNQPRSADNPGFSAESIAEIGSTIKQRGVKSPISVRENLDKPGFYLINHGARRYRGSKWAELTHIPGFVDNDYNEADQVIENLQRNELTAREIADHIGRELAKGRKKGEIAASLGKSNAFVSQHATLLDLPDVVADVFNSGRVRDVTLVNELVKAYKEDAAVVAAWLQDEAMGDITRASVSLLREFLKEKASEGVGKATAEDAKAGGESAPGSDEGDGASAKEKKQPKSDPSKLKRAIVQVRFDDRPARLLLDRRPSHIGLAWFRYDDDGSEFEADIGLATLAAVVEA